jgi:hypothetical protein
MKFIYKPQDAYVKQVKVEIDDRSTLSEALESFEGFLLAAGYVFDGHVTITEYDDEDCCGCCGSNKNSPEE